MRQIGVEKCQRLRWKLWCSTSSPLAPTSAVALMLIVGSADLIWKSDTAACPHLLMLLTA